MTDIQCERCDTPILTLLCEDCGKHLCLKHSDRDKHPCEDSIKGAHGMIGGTR